MGLSAGQRVRRRGSHDEGVVLAVVDGFVTVAFARGNVTVHEDDLQPPVVSPERLLAAGELQDSHAHLLTLFAAYLRHAYRYDTLSGLSNARIEPEPHQVFVAHRVASKLAPRMILADEVGLGKTIEAALVLKELRARQLVERVLVVTPASLMRQWRTELATKFNETFTILDGPAVKYLGKDGRNPWRKVDNVICSLPFASNPRRAEQIVEADWDLVIFDEAHRVRRTRPRSGDAHVTQAYRLADELKDNVSGLLLLTATPIQLHAFELYSLIELVEPGLYRSFEHFERVRTLLPELNDLMRTIQGWDTYSARQQQDLVKDHEPMLRKIGFDNRPLSLSEHRAEAMDRLAELHPLAKALVRNRKSQLGILSERRASRFTVAQTREEADLYDEISGYIVDTYQQAVSQRNLAVGFLMVTYQKMLTSSSQALRTSLRRRAERLREGFAGKKHPAKLGRDDVEELLDAEEPSEALDATDTSTLADAKLALEVEHLEGLANRLSRIRDSKADKLLEVLDALFSEKPGEKVVIFTQFIETQSFLAFMLHGNGYRTALFNGRMKLEEKEEQIDQFRRDAQILLSTEAGGEGRNLQFCHYLVNYDLPWNPMRVEQRIGRLDRIGQQHPVVIYNLAYEGTVEQRVLDVLEQRIRLFEESIGALDPILGDVEKDIQRIVLGDATRASARLEQYGADIEQQVRAARAREQTLADLVLDRASLRRDKANELLQQRPLAGHRDLETFTARALEYLGGTLTEHPDGGRVVSLSPRLASRLGTRQAVIRGAFDPNLALALDGLEFLAFGHDLVDRLLAHTGELPESQTGARLSGDAPPGDWVEIIYRISGGGVRPRGVLLRHLIGPDLVVVSTRMHSMDFTAETIDMDVPQWTAAAVVASQRTYQEEFAAERDGLRQMHEQTREEEVDRAERIFRYKEDRFTLDIRRAREWLDARGHDASERDKRIIPARRGRLAKDEERMTRLRADFETETDKIRATEIQVEGQVLSAGLVRGPA
jgi:SNF2 family DNA or RNA helicase